ncbi:AMP-binding protein [Alicyclobacillus dauci]|uniref:AMP-binding protein n=1 Tax=Alicyclobacillus dauci TaxID=1475485 RepID=A0ABY6Z409_9BACL|nr:AMP-binding protein [Alicyclobacillus dauci]WAH37605.1 AMP-binding protein [Alicyclobacillus dauci]
MSILTRSLWSMLSQTNGPVVYDGDDLYNTKKLATDVSDLSDQVREMGIGNETKVVLALPNSYAFTVAYIALLLTGAVVVPVNPTLPATEMERFMSRFEAKAVLMQDDAESGWADIFARTGLHPLGTAAELSLPGTALWLRVSASSEQAPELRTPDEDAPAVLMFTSGTTGNPKGVLLRHRHVMAAALHVVESHALTQEDVSYCILPLFHINAQVIVLLSTLLSGGTLVMADRFHASRFWQDVAKHQVTWVSCVPTILSILTKRDVLEGSTASLRFVRSASAPLSPAILARFESQVGVPVIESYGMTEAAGQICVNPLPPGLRKTGSVGKPYGIDLKVVDDEGRAVAAFDVGEIAIRGANVIEGYWNVGEEPGSATEQGWIHTGDLGYVDNDGYVFITGRRKEIINRAGEKLSPREIEDTLNGHIDVASSAVIGLPDPLYGERVVAWVVPTDFDGTDATQLKRELQALCLRSLAKHKCPSEFIVARSVPVGPTGKVQKHLLRDKVAAARLA